MMDKFNTRTRYLLTAVYLLMVIVIFTLPFYSSEKYSLVQNTTSQLGAQNTPNAWVMNIVFFFLGFFTILSFLKFYKDKPLVTLLASVFGLSLIMTAFFSHAPIDNLIVYNQVEDQMHSLFASVTGFSFVLLAFVSGFTHSSNKRKFLAIAIGILATILSVLIFSIENFAGIWQRLLFILSFAWIIFETNNRYDLSK